MTIAQPRSNESRYTAEDDAVRCELAAIYRLLAHFQMTDLIYTHVSARLPGGHDRFLINPYGMLFHEICASDLVEVGADGFPVDADSGALVNPAGFNIHSAIHAGRPEVRFVIHTHTRAGAAVSCQKDGLLPISQHALMFYDRLGYHEYEGFALDSEERARLIQDIGDHKGLIMRNHGLLVVGRTAAEAFNRIYTLERACDIQIAALAGGRELVEPTPQVQAHTGHQANPEDLADWEELGWTAALRLLGQGNYRN
ncbi:class II aldolase/adducin family protein [Sphingomonas bacterium]|uniref:class II aldolase/adducin family protein n=1 Tax=Sphingomonas bacterium TaxID=1895847 RepID=UPI001C2DD2EC|nr:class II aldolase/adducin family protein [Sphingomonas bacterium]